MCPIVGVLCAPPRGFILLVMFISAQCQPHRGFWIELNWRRSIADRLDFIQFPTPLQDCRLSSHVCARIYSVALHITFSHKYSPSHGPRAPLHYPHIFGRRHDPFIHFSITHLTPHGPRVFPRVCGIPCVAGGLAHSPTSPHRITSPLKEPVFSERHVGC